jgi:glutamate-1-semialdehyde 2,1-aminomutase
MGCVLPKEGFLEGLRKICDEEGIVLILDEVMTGFRLSKGGAQERFNIKPDLTTLGKIIGGGMPVGAYGGRAEIMNWVSPAGPVYQAGTLSGNPIAMAAGMTMLTYLNEHPEVYTQLERSGNKLATGFKNSMEKLGLNYTLNHIGSMYTLFFTPNAVTDFTSAKSSDLPLFGKYFHAMLNRGIYMGPSQFEAMFLSTALTDEHLDRIIVANEEALVSILND